MSVPVTDSTPVHPYAVLKTSNGTALLDKRYCVDFNKEIPEYTVEGVQAYAVADQEEPENSLVAYYTDQHYALNFRQAQILQKSKLNMVVRPLAWWPVLHKDSKPRLLVVAERNAQSKFDWPLSDQHQRLNEDELTKKLLMPAYKMLTHLDAQNSSHRGINPANLYINDIAGGIFTFGPGYLVSPGSMQPPAFEPMESALADPGARGDGSIASDMYALGMTVFCLATGVDMLHPDVQSGLIEQRLLDGSFAAITQNYRLPPRVMDLLKGLLADQRSLRWSLDELEVWLQKGKVAPRHNPVIKKPSRPFEIKGRGYATVSALSHALGRSSINAVQTLTSNELEIWLVRSNATPDIFERLKLALGMATRNKSAASPDLIAAFGLTGLHPGGPLYFKGTAFSIDGLGCFLQANMHEPQQKQTVGEMIRHKLPLFWLGLQQSPPLEWMKLNSIYEKAAVSISRQIYGHGIERILYELCPEMPCISELFAQSFVTEAAHILPTLEYLAARQIPRVSPIDRHIAAYLAVHGDLVSERDMTDLSVTDGSGKQAQAMIHILAILEKKFGAGGGYPNVCKWALNVYNNGGSSFCNVKRQKALDKELEAACKTGSLQKLYEAIDKPQQQKEDLDQFAAAKSIYAKLVEELQGCRQDEFKINENAVSYAKRYAPLVACGLGSLMIMISILTNR